MTNTAIRLTRPDIVSARRGEAFGIEDILGDNILTGLGIAPDFILLYLQLFPPPAAAV